MPNNPTEPSWRIYLGLFLITLATLSFEVLLTRIFSVTMWYYLGFFAVALSMFGMTVGALLVYMRPGIFTSERLGFFLALSTLLFSWAAVGSVLTHLTMPYLPDASLLSAFSLSVNFVVIALPFVFSGICVCLVLTRFPTKVSGLYAADLTGAACGCFALIAALHWADGPTAVFFVALAGSLAALTFVSTRGEHKLFLSSLCSVLFFLLFIAINIPLAANGKGLIKVLWTKGSLEKNLLYEQWNSFSRITVKSFNPLIAAKLPFSWGLGSSYKPEREMEHLWLDIDSAAGTPLTPFTGDTAELEHLSFDVNSVAHHLRKDARVLVVGVGGGIDLLSALAFDQKSVEGVEINESIIQALTGPFAEYTGHLGQHPKVTLVNDEARSFIERQQTKYDIIQISLIDTFAASSAGAFVLSEHSLYTVEAWKLFLSRLNERGILSVTRWYGESTPVQTYRTVSLAVEALQQLGVKNAKEHILVLTNKRHPYLPAMAPVATVLLSKEPFSPADLRAVRAVVEQSGFNVVYLPGEAKDAVVNTLITQNAAQLKSEYPFNLEAPTDDKPFFFYFLKLKTFLNREALASSAFDEQAKAVSVLYTLLILVSVLSYLCIIVPLRSFKSKAPKNVRRRNLAFFAAIGLGFIFVEISQMQRLVVFLGHPTYSLSVILFTLLVAGGLGSALTARIPTQKVRERGLLLLASLLLLLTAYGFCSELIIDSFRDAGTSIRIIVSVGLLFVIGLFMGMPFPLGMKAASEEAPLDTPWFWGVNGAASVLGSVLAVVVALASTIGTAFWLGTAAYLCALLCFAIGSRKTQRRPT